MIPPTTGKDSAILACLAWDATAINMNAAIMYTKFIPIKHLLLKDGEQNIFRYGNLQLPLI